MTDQLAINENGQIVAQPMTWDDQPLYSPSTIREGLFAVEAFGADARPDLDEH